MSKLKHTDLPDNIFVTSAEAAEFLGVSLRTVCLWSNSGLLQYWIESDGHRYIFMDSVLQLIKAREAQNEQQPPIAGSSSSALKVLIVEDDFNLIRLYRMQLVLWPMELELSFASNGYQGLVMLGSNPPHLMITDLKMPNMNGIQMLKILKGMSELDSTEIVVVTGLNENELGAQSGMLDGIRIMPKPIPFAKLEKIAVEIAIKNNLPLKNIPDHYNVK